MKKQKKLSTDTEKLCQAIIIGMQEKKGLNIIILDLRKIKNTIAQFFIVCSGSSGKQVNAIAESIESCVYHSVKENPWHMEGSPNYEWMLLDYIDVVAHVFQKERRSFYALEHLWGDSHITEIDNKT